MTKTSNTLPPYTFWVRQTCDYADQPEETYAERHSCYNCSRLNFFYIRKGTPVDKAHLTCENCGVEIS